MKLIHENENILIIYPVIIKKNYVHSFVGAFLAQLSLFLVGRIKTNCLKFAKPDKRLN